MKKKRENRKEKKERKSKEVNSKCAILNGIIKSRFKTDIKNLLIRDSLQIGEGGGGWLIIKGKNRLTYRPCISPLNGNENE